MKQQITQDREDLFLVWSEFWFLTLTVVVCSKNGLVDFQGRDFRTSFQKSNKVELPCSEEPNLVPRVFSFSNITLTPTQIAKAIWEGMPISPGFWETREDPRYGFEESERQKRVLLQCVQQLYTADSIKLLWELRSGKLFFWWSVKKIIAASSVYLMHNWPLQKIP